MTPTKTPPPPDHGRDDVDPDDDEEERRRRQREEPAPAPAVDISQMQTAPLPPLPPLPIARPPTQPPPALPDGVEDIAEQQTGLLSASPAARDRLREEMIQQHRAAAAKARQRAAEHQPVIDVQAERVRLLTAHLGALRRIPARQRTGSDQHQIGALAAGIVEEERELGYLRQAQANIVAMRHYGTRRPQTSCAARWRQRTIARHRGAPSASARHCHPTASEHALMA